MEKITSNLGQHQEDIITPLVTPVSDEIKKETPIGIIDGALDIFDEEDTDIVDEKPPIYH